MNGKYHDAAKGADEGAEALAALTEAQRRFAEQRIAAVKLAEEARLLEERLAVEAEKARVAAEKARRAADRAQVIRLTPAVEHARRIETEAADQLESLTAKHERRAAERAEAEAHKRSCYEAEHSAAAELAKAEALLAEARERLQYAKTALTDAVERETTAVNAEVSSRSAALDAEELLHDRRVARESLENELDAIEQRIKASVDEEPSLEPVEQTDDLKARNEQISEAARRIAERRAADAARRGLRS
jgi:chromosome segregation ATPase